MYCEENHGKAYFILTNNYNLDKEEKIKTQNISKLNYCIRPSMKTELSENIQQSKKFAAINSSKAISGAMGNSGISVELLV
jgi:hypothetical protein